jgi:hypothetical protein
VRCSAPKVKVAGTQLLDRLKSYWNCIKQS